MGAGAAEASSWCGITGLGDAGVLGVLEGMGAFAARVRMFCELWFDARTALLQTTKRGHTTLNISLHHALTLNKHTHTQSGGGGSRRRLEQQ